MYVCMYVCMYVYMDTLESEGMSKGYVMHIHLHTYTHTHRAHTHTHTHTHKHIHTVYRNILTLLCWFDSFPCSLLLMVAHEDVNGCACACGCVCVLELLYIHSYTLTSLRCALHKISDTYIQIRGLG